jgi:putative ABC transport system permease protein
MTAVVRKVLADLRRRRLQTAVIAVVILLASGTATLALNLLFSSTNPYDQAFTQQRGAHDLQEFNSRGVTAGQLRRTAHLPVVSAAAGPWATIDVTVEPARIPSGLTGLAAAMGPPKVLLQVVGRADPQGPVDDLRLISGRWVHGGHEIVLTRSLADAQGISLGDVLNALVGGRRVPLLVVGEAIDVDEMDAANQNPQHAWMVPAAIPALIGPGETSGYEMAYRFQRAAENADIRAALVQIKAALPAGALSFTRSYIDVRDNYTLTDALILTFLLAFSVFALGAAALVIANIVTGTVLAGFREIGIMRAIGYTPVQVVKVLIGQMLIPALAGCVLGMPLGVLLSRPLLARSADALGLPPSSSFSPPALMLVLGGVILVVTVSAALPAIRAGLLSPVRAIVAGSAPESHRGRRLLRTLAELPLPQAIRLGVGQTFIRPLRAGFTTIAILIGVATVTFAFGVRATLVKGLNDPAINGGSYQITVDRLPPYSDARVMRTLRSQPETLAIVARDWTSMAVDGLSQPVQAVFTRGDAARLGLHQAQGRWYRRPDEAVAPAAFLKEAHLHIGQYFYGAINGQRVRLHLVGTVFDTAEFGRILHMDFSTLAAVMPGERPTNYLVRLHPRANVQAYAIRVNRSSPRYLAVGADDSSASSVISTVDDVVVVLALVLAAIAVAAVFNTVLLNTRERVRDTAILKAVGMGPGQTVLMITTSAALLGLIGGVLGIPIGVALHAVVLQVMADLVGNDISTVQYQVYSAPILGALVLAGIMVAVLGAYLPARWAATSRVADVLHAE